MPSTAENHPTTGHAKEQAPVIPDGNRFPAMPLEERQYPHRRRRALAMWALFAVAVVIIIALSVAGAPAGWIGAVFGTLIIGCLLACAATVWSDARSARNITRAVDQLRARRGGR